MTNVSTRFIIKAYPTFVYSGNKEMLRGILLEITDTDPVNEGQTPVVTRFTCPPEIDVIHGVATGFVSEITGISTDTLEDLIGIRDESFLMTKTETFNQ